MKFFIYCFLKHQHFSKEVITSVLDNYSLVKKYNKKAIRNFVSSYNLNFNLVKEVDAFYNQVFDLEIPRYEFDLLSILILTKKLKGFYRKKRLPLSMYYEVTKDILYKVNECVSVKGVIGIFVLSWYQATFNMSLFSFGRLQYLPCHPEIQNDDTAPYKIAVSIHIPRSGEPLDKNAIDDSIDRAFNFYKKYLGAEHILFQCSSWLLFEGNKEFLNPNSNILAFASRFKIEKTVYFDDYKELWRIFNVEIKDYQSLIDSSSLTHGYINYMKENKKIGKSYGYFIR